MRGDVDNYRSISILSCPGKLLEKIMCIRLTDKLEPVISSCQHAYLKGRSTTTNLLEFVSNTIVNMEDGFQVDALYLDFKKAFDSINHDLLLAKLRKYDVDHDTIGWLRSYLSGRNQQVRINGVVSTAVPVTSGVPQGSHIGPILFVFFLEDLVQHLGVSSCSVYADDMKLHRVVRCTQDQLELKNLLERVERWSAINDMNLNPSKCQHMIYTRAQQVKQFRYSIGDTVLRQVNIVRDLGVILDSKLTMTKHIDTVISKARATLGLVKFFSRGFDNSKATKTLYCALVRSLLEYAAPVWSPVAT